MKILLVNDDGIDSEGLRLLAERLGHNNEVTVVAPDRQRSAASHSLTLHTGLHAKELELKGAKKAWAVSGTPGDCTRLGLDVLCSDAELVISGPNVGYNIAFDCHYSGTVGAAMEAAMHNVPGIAVSAPYTADVYEVVDIFVTLFSQLDIHSDIKSMLNINIPGLKRSEIKGVRWVPMGTYHQWDDHYELNEDGSSEGLIHFKINGVERDGPDEPVDDASAVMNGYIAVTPLGYDYTERSGFAGRELSL